MTDQPRLFAEPEAPAPIDLCDLPRVPGRDLPCLRHNSYHSSNECRAMSQAAEDAFEAAGGFNCADGRHKNSSVFLFACKDMGYEYCGYFIENDGSHTFKWYDPK